MCVCVCITKQQHMCVCAITNTTIYTLLLLLLYLPVDDGMQSMGNREHRAVLEIYANLRVRAGERDRGRDRLGLVSLG